MLEIKVFSRTLTSSVYGLYILSFAVKNKNLIIVWSIISNYYIFSRYRFLCT